MLIRKEFILWNFADLITYIKQINFICMYRPNLVTPFVGLFDKRGTTTSPKKFETHYRYLVLNLLLGLTHEARATFEL